jgi:Gluconate 2-dehydrogenase subunit 3
MARKLHCRDFLELTWREQDDLLKTIRDGKPAAALDLWQRMPVHRFWTLLVEDCVEAYYAHPWSWDEIGYGGPAYPRGYFRLERGEPEPWEVEEKRYFWQAPPDTVSDFAGSEEGENLAHLQQGDIHH